MSLSPNVDYQGGGEEPVFDRHTDIYVLFMYGKQHWESAEDDESTLLWNEMKRNRSLLHFCFFFSLAKYMYRRGGEKKEKGRESESISGPMLEGCM